MARTAPSKPSGIKVDRIKIVLIAIFVALVPWFYLPISFEFFDSAKTLLTAFVVGSFALICAREFWVSKKVTFVRTPFDKPIAAVVLAYVLATIFSVHPATSVWGFYSRLSDGLIGILIFVALYYVIVHNFKKTKDVLHIMRAWSLSVVSLAIFVILQYFGLLGWLWDGVNSGGGFLTYNDRFLPVSSPAALPILFLVTLPVVVSLLYFGKRAKNDPLKVLITIGSILLTLGAAISIAMVGASTLPVLLIGILFGVLLLRFKEKIGVNHFHVGTVIVFALVFSFVFMLPGVHEQLNLPPVTSESQLDLRTSTQVATQSLVGDGANGLLFGSGPETFRYTFTSDRPVEFNNTPEWSQRFTNSRMEMLDVVHGLGLIGIVAFVYLVYTLLRFASDELALFNKSLTKATTILIPLTSSLLVSVFMLFLLPFNSVNWIFLFVTLALLVVVHHSRSSKAEKEATVILQSHTGASKLSGNELLPRLVAVSIVVFILVGTYMVGRQYVADMHLLRSVYKLQLAQTRTDLTTVIQDVTSARLDAQYAVLRSPDKPYLQRNLALISIREAELRSRLEPETQDQLNREVSVIESLFRTSVFAIQNAVVQNRADVESHESAAQIYAAMYNMSGGERYGIETLGALESSLTVDPYNPDHYINTGLFLYRLNQVDEAEINFRKAFSLRTDYYSSILTLGSLLEGKEDLEEARVFYEQVLAIPTVGEDTALGQELLRRLNSLGDNTLQIEQDEALQLNTGEEPQTEQPVIEPTDEQGSSQTGGQQQLVLEEEGQQ